MLLYNLIKMKKNLIIKKITAFTLIEIIVVVVILSVLTSLALPRHLITLERSRAQEGKQTLLAVFQSQKRFFADNGFYTDALTNLDITISTSAYFQAPVANNSSPIAQITRNGGSFRLDINSDGTITCTQFVAGKCAQVGY